MFSYIKNLNQGVKFLLINSILGVFAGSFIPLFLKNKEFSLSGIVLVYALYTGLSILIGLLTTKFYIKKYLLFGIFLQSLMSLVFFFYTDFSFLMYILFGGLNLIFFWVPLNYAFFRDSVRRTNAKDSSLFILIPGVISIIIPPVSAFIIKDYGFKWIFLISFIFYLLSIMLMMFFTRNMKEDAVYAPNLSGTREFKGLKSITILEGAFQFFSGAIIPVYSLIFLKTEHEVGLFFSFLGVISLVIALLLAKKSDDEHKRKGYLYFFFTLSIISILSLIFAKTVLLWVILAGIFTSLYNISFPLRLAISMDRKKPDISFWKFREIFLNIGRVSTLLIASILFFYKLYAAMFAFYAVLIALYSILLKYKLKNLQ